MVDDSDRGIVGKPRLREPDARIGMLGLIPLEVEIEENGHGRCRPRQIEEHVGHRGIGRCSQPQPGLDAHGRDRVGEFDIRALDFALGLHRHRWQPAAIDRLLEQPELVRPRLRPPVFGCRRWQAIGAGEHGGQRELADGGFVVVGIGGHRGNGGEMGKQAAESRGPSRAPTCDIAPQQRE